MFSSSLPFTSACRGRGDRGQTTVLVTMVAALAILTAVLIAQLGAVAVDRARARTAADAAALAAAAEGPSRASDVAANNGGTVERVELVAGGVEVTVRVGRATATSRAAARVRSVAE